MYATPIIYPADLVKNPTKRLLLGINPLSGVVEGFRWCILGGRVPPPGPMLAVSTVTILALLAGGLFYFRRMEKSFADLV